MSGSHLFALTLCLTNRNAYTASFGRSSITPAFAGLRDEQNFSNRSGESRPAVPVRVTGRLAGVSPGEDDQNDTPAEFDAMVAAAQARPPRRNRANKA